MLRARLLVSLFALLALSSAISLNDIHIDGIEEYLHHGEKRQATGTGNTPSSAPPTSTPRASTPTPTPTPTPDPSTSRDDPTSNPPTSNQPASTPTSNTPQTSNTPTSRASTPTPVTSESVTTSRSTITRLITTTDANGQQTVATETSETEIPLTSKIVSTPSPQGQDSSGSGLSSNEKSIIGGVVGGVGGALLLGGIGLVFWRMKKRQNRVTEDDDDLMAGTGAALGDKPHNTNATSPFQSNLEQYHNPGGRPNAAANF